MDTTNANEEASMARVKQEPGADEPTNGTGSAHNGQPHVGGRMQIKNEKISDDEVSDAETEKNFALDSPRGIERRVIPKTDPDDMDPDLSVASILKLAREFEAKKSPRRTTDEPMDGTKAIHGHRIVTKIEPEEVRSDEDTDVEMDMDLNLINDFDPTMKIKTEPEPSISVASIFDMVRECKANEDASSKEKSDDLNITKSDESKKDNEVGPPLTAESHPTEKFETDPGTRSVDFDADFRNEILVTTQPSVSSQPFAKRKPDHQPKENRTKKQRDMSSTETIVPSTSAAAFNRGNAKYDESQMNIYDNQPEIFATLSALIEREIAADAANKIRGNESECDETPMNMFCEDKIPDNEKADEDAGLMELKELVEDKLTEDENFEMDIMERMKTEFTKCTINLQNPNASADARAALLKRLEYLSTTIEKDIIKRTNEEFERNQAEKTEECGKLLQDLFGNVDWKPFLKNWDDKFTYSKLPSTSAGPSSSSSAFSANSGDTEAKDESDSLYDQFVNKRMPKPMKPDDDKRNVENALVERIRKIVEKCTQPFLKKKLITQNQFNKIVEDTTGFCFELNVTDGFKIQDHINGVILRLNTAK